MSSASVAAVVFSSSGADPFQDDVHTDDTSAEIDDGQVFFFFFFDEGDDDDNTAVAFTVLAVASDAWLLVGVGVVGSIVGLRVGRFVGTGADDPTKRKGFVSAPLIPIVAPNPSPIVAPVKGASPTSGYHPAPREVAV